MHLVRLLALLGLCLLTASCGDGPASPDAGTPDWQWLNPTAGSGANLQDVWSIAPDRAIAVGDRGTILLYDGQTCRKVPSGVAANLRAIWRLGELDFIVVGTGSTVLRGNGLVWSAASISGDDVLLDVWASSAADIYVTGFTLNESAASKQRRGFPSALVLHGDGRAWRPIPAPGAVSSFACLAGTGRGDVYFGFATSPAYRYADGGWSVFSMGLNADNFGTGVYALWSLPTGHVFAAGNGGQVRRFDGSRWSALNLDDHATTYGVWAPDSVDVWVAGGSTGGAFAAHHDGTAWQRDDGMASAALSAIHGTTPDDLYAVGSLGVFLRHGADGWRPVNGFTANDVDCIWGPSADDLHFGGIDGLFHYDGRRTRPVATGLARVKAIWGSGPDDLYVAGTPGPGGPIGLARFDGVSWRPETIAGFAYLDVAGVTGDGQGNIHAIAGERIYRRGDGGWESVFESGLGSAWRAIRAFPSGQAVAVGNRGALAVYDGDQWSLADSGTSDNLVCLWGADAGTVRAGTNRGAIIARTADGWTREAQLAYRDIKALWGRSATDLMAVSGDRLFRGDGATWTEAADRAPFGVLAGWAAPDGGVVLAGSAGGVVRAAVIR